VVDECLAFTVAVDDEEREVTTGGDDPRERCRPADGEHHGIVGQGLVEVISSRIASNLTGEFDGAHRGIRRDEHLGAQPPQRCGRRVPLDDTARGEHERMGITGQFGQSVGRFTHECAHRCSVGACHISQALDGVHRRHVSSGLLPSRA
jgi:hypothetical protein